MNGLAREDRWQHVWNKRWLVRLGATRHKSIRRVIVKSINWHDIIWTNLPICTLDTEDKFTKMKLYRLQTFTMHWCPASDNNVTTCASNNIVHQRDFQFLKITYSEVHKSNSGTVVNLTCGSWGSNQDNVLALSSRESHCLRYSVHAMNTARHQVAADLWTKQTDLSHRPACIQPVNCIHHCQYIYYYIYSFHHPTEGRRLSRPQKPGFIVCSRNPWKCLNLE